MVAALPTVVSICFVLKMSSKVTLTVPAIAASCAKMLCSWLAIPPGLNGFS